MRLYQKSRNDGGENARETQNLHSLTVCQLYVTASPVWTYKLSILKNLRVKGTKTQYPCGFTF